MKFRSMPRFLPHFQQHSKKEISGVLNYWDSSREILSWPAFVSIIYIQPQKCLALCHLDCLNSPCSYLQQLKCCTSVFITPVVFEVAKQQLWLIRHLNETAHFHSRGVALHMGKCCSQSQTWLCTWGNAAPKAKPSKQNLSLQLSKVMLSAGILQVKLCR